MTRADVPEVLEVPPGSLVVIRSDDMLAAHHDDESDDGLPGLVAQLRTAAGHARFVVVVLPSAADVSVVHDPEQLDRLLGVTPAAKR